MEAAVRETPSSGRGRTRTCVKEQNVRHRRPLPTDGEPNGRLLVDLLDADALAAALDADRLR